MPVPPTYRDLKRQVRRLKALEMRHTRALRTLSHERNLYRDLVASQPAGVYRVRVGSGKVRAGNPRGARLWPRLQIEMASDAFCRILGVTLADCMASAAVIADRIHPDDAAEFTRRNVEAANTLRRFEWEGRILNRGRVRWIHLMSLPRPLDNGDVIWTGILLDITERKRAAAALRESENLYHSLFEQAGDSIVVFDPRTTAILDFNDAACRRLGYTREEFARLKIGDLDVLETTTDVRRHSRRVTAGAEAAFETRHRTKSGTILDVEVRPKAVTVGGRTVIQAIWHDITESKRTAERLRLANEELEAKVRERTSRLQALAAELTQIEQKERRRIAYVLHEDLQQRLVAMQYKVLGLRQQGVERSTAETLERLRQELDEAVRLTRDLTTRIYPPVLNQFGLGAAIEWLAHDMHAQHGLGVRIAGPRSYRLPSSEMQSFAFEAIRELLLNVVKHAGAGEAEIRVDASRRRAIRIDVRDAGKGCADLNGDPSSFGLFSVRERAQALGAAFDIVSTPGKGTCATLTLPLSPPDGAAATRRARPPARKARRAQ